LAPVKHHLLGLAPAGNLARCERDELQVVRRLRSVLEEAGGSWPRIDRWGPCCDLPATEGVAARAYLRPVDGLSAVSLSAHPADTLTQAKAFYTRPKLIGAVRALAGSEGWSLRHNFHFGHFETGYAWTHGPVEPAGYIDLWAHRIRETRTVRRHEWGPYFAWLVHEGIAVPDDEAEFDRCFTETNRTTAAPRPALALAYRWPIHVAESLDGRTGFVSRVREGLVRLAALGT
jgi:hypothetical protein